MALPLLPQDVQSIFTGPFVTGPIANQDVEAGPADYNQWMSSGVDQIDQTEMNDLKNEVADLREMVLRLQKLVIPISANRKTRVIDL